MQFYDRALGAARSAQERIKDILTEAVQAQAYPEVAKVAALADRLAIALAPEGEIASANVPSNSAERDVIVKRPSSPSLSNPKSVRADRASAAQRRTKRGAKAAPRKTGKRAKGLPEGYPRFEREADRLIKVGWSSRDQRGYEHRATKSVVFSFVNHLRSHSDSPFAMEDVLPITDESGAELPSYQAYLAVGWLRSVGAVRKVGKDGYSIDPALASPEALEKLWHTVPTR